MIVIKAIIFLWIFWGLYVLIMGLYRAKLDGRLTKGVRILGYPYLIIGLLVDFVANVTIFSLLFLELPREWLVTSRLKRHLNSDEIGFRFRLANTICGKLLDIFDPTGAHCD